MHNRFDDLITNTLKEEAENMAESPELYGRIKACINDGSSGSRGLFSFRKQLAAAMSCIIILVAFVFIFPTQTIALAAEVANAVKTFFVLDKDMKVVEKPADKVYMMYSTSGTAFQSDAEIGKLLGYKVTFPEFLPEGYRLECKAIGVGLGKEILDSTFKSIEKSMREAAQDDDELRKLQEFKPYRYVFGCYENKEGLNVFINVDPFKASVESGLEEVNTKKVAIGDTDGYWDEFIMPVYAIKIENGISSSDMTKPPAKIITKHTLRWVNGNRKYSMNFDSQNDTELTPESAVKIAEEFAARQP